VKCAVAIAGVLCLFLAGCGGDEPGLSPDQQKIFETVEAYGEARHRGDYEKAWDYLNKDWQDLFALLLTAPGSGARATVESKRTIIESEFTDPGEKEKARAVLEKYPPWESLKTMSAKQYYVWRMNRDDSPKARSEAKDYFHRNHVQELAIEGNKAVITWTSKDADKVHLVKEGEKWLICPNPARMKELEMMRSLQEKR
jgi:hypothetical protein